MHDADRNKFTESPKSVPQKHLYRRVKAARKAAQPFKNTYSFFLLPFFLKFLGFLPAVIVSSFVQILTERVPF